MAKINEIGFVPVGDKILIEMIEEKTTSGLVLVNATDKKPSYGVVLAVGDEVPRRDKSNLSLVGETVAFPDWVAQPIYVDRVKMFIMSYDEIFGYFKGKAV